MCYFISTTSCYQWGKWETAQRGDWPESALLTCTRYRRVSETGTLNKTGPLNSVNITGHWCVRWKAVSLRKTISPVFVWLGACQAESQCGSAPSTQTHQLHLLSPLSNWLDKQPPSGEDEKALQCGQISQPPLAAGKKPDSPWWSHLSCSL